MHQFDRFSTAGLILAGFLASTVRGLPAEEVSPPPPMGWNSFDAYDSAINEAQFKATVDFMAEHLGQFGWEYAVVDYIWFNLDADGDVFLPVEG